jgi:hypothetical protein
MPIVTLRTLSVVVWLMVMPGITYAQAQPEVRPAPEPHRLIFHALIGVNMSLHGGDAMQTAYCLGSQQCREGNPVLAPFSSHPFWFGVTKLGIATGVSAAAIRLHKTHPRWAAGILAGSLALETYAVIQNNRKFPPSAR